MNAALVRLLVPALLAHGILLMIELGSRHPVHDVAMAARLITRGGYRGRFWAGVVLGGIVAPIVVVLANADAASALFNGLVASLALAGLWLWEDLWVKAGQSVPLS